MCTMIVERAAISGSGKASQGWFELGAVNVSYDHPFHAPLEHALNLDFVNEAAGPGGRRAHPGVGPPAGAGHREGPRAGRGQRLRRRARRAARVSRRQ